MRIRLVFFFLSLLCLSMGNACKAQTQGWNLYQPGNENPVLEEKDTLNIQLSSQPTNNGPGVVIYHQDSIIDQLTLDYIENPPQLHGYRIQLFSGSNVEANSVYGTFIAQNLDLRAYKEWRSPNYVVKVGDFKTKLDAQRLLMKIKGQFPGAFLIRDEIQKMKL